jgi:hypothetical protein
MSQAVAIAQQTRPSRRWSIDGFKSFWAKADVALVPLVHEVSTSDIVGYWPRPIGVVRGSESYVKVIDAIFRVCPDLSVTAVEYVQSGDLHFVRWSGTGTGPNGQFEFNGLDRVRTTADGLVCENYVFCDHPFFAEVAASLRANADGH